MFFTSYSLMLKAFFPLFFLVSFLLLLIPQSLLNQLQFSFSLSLRLCSLQLVSWFSMYFFFFFFLLHPQMNAGTFKIGTSGGHH